MKENSNENYKRIIKTDKALKDLICNLADAIALYDKANQEENIGIYEFDKIRADYQRATKSLKDFLGDDEKSKTLTDCI